MGRFVIKTAKNGQFFFNLEAENWKTILTSEMYSAKSGCNTGIESVRANCSIDSRYDRNKSTNNKYYFNLKAVNGQIIGTSEMYEASSGMETGIASVKINGTSKTVTEE